MPDLILIFCIAFISLIGKSELLYGLFIGAAMIAGSWAGKKIIEQ